MALVLLELLLASFFLIWFGLGALGVALLVWLAPSVAVGVQLLAWAFTSVVLTLLWFKVFRADKQPGLQWSVEDAIGEVGLLTTTVSPFQRGKVRFQKPLMGADEWPCLADAHINAGERVQVLAVEGNLVRVGIPTLP